MNAREDPSSPLKMHLRGLRLPSGGKNVSNRLFIPSAHVGRLHSDGSG
jgi:hypothetical protein